MTFDPINIKPSPCPIARSLTIAGAVLVSACSNVSLQQDARSDLAPMDTILSNLELRTHLDFLNGPEINGRATGTRGLVRASAYASARLNEYGAQPMIPHEFSSIYATSLHSPISVEFVQYTADTLRLETGVEFYPDGRTNSGSIHFRSVLWNPDAGADLSGEVVWLSGGIDTDNALLQLATRGAAAILIEGPLTVSQYDRPISASQIIRVAPDARRLFQFTGEPQPGRIQLPFEAGLSTTVQSLAVGSAQNTSGMVPGANPVLRNELVIVAARLDGFGAVNGVTLTDGTDLALGAAALLETARVAAAIQDRLGAYGRTILFSFFSGSQFSQSGMRALLRHPLWARSAIHSLIYVADAGESTGEVTHLATEYGIRLQIIGTPAISPQGEFLPRDELFAGDLADEAVGVALDTAHMVLLLLSREAGEGSVAGF